VDLGQYGRMRAVQTGGGLNAVFAEATLSGSPQFAFSAGTDVQWGITNSSPISTSLIFQYHLSGGHLALYDPTDEFLGGTATVDVRLFAGAPHASTGPIWQWILSLTGQGGQVHPSLLLFDDPFGLGSPGISAVTINNGVAALDIDPFTATIDLGQLGPNLTANIRYTMRADVAEVGGVATGGLAQLGDPFSVSGDFGAGITIVAPVAAVPEPATWSLVALGLAALVAVRRRRPNGQRRGVRTGRS